MCVVITPSASESWLSKWQLKLWKLQHLNFTFYYESEEGRIFHLVSHVSNIAFCSLGTSQVMFSQCFFWIAPNSDPVLETIAADKVYYQDGLVVYIIGKNTMIPMLTNTSPFHVYSPQLHLPSVLSMLLLSKFVGVNS